MAATSPVETSPSYTLWGEADNLKMSLSSDLGTLDPHASLGSGDSASFGELLLFLKAMVLGAGGMVSNCRSLQGAGGGGAH